MRPTAIAALLLALGLPFRQASAATEGVRAGGSNLSIQVSTPSPYYSTPWGFGAGPDGYGPYGYWSAYPYDDWPNPYGYVAECTPTWNGGIYCPPGGPPQYYFPPAYIYPPQGGFSFGAPARPGGHGPHGRPHHGGGSFHGDTQRRPMP